MTMWNTPNSPKWGTKNELVGHARRASGSAAGQWKAGDIMFASEADARRAVARQFGVMKVGGKLVSSAADVTGKLKAFGDVSVAGDLSVDGALNLPDMNVDTPGTVVTDIDHNHGPASDGKYPHFSTSSWSSQIGSTTWKTGEGNYYVYQVRGGTIIWAGKMTMWNGPNSPTWGTKNKLVGHARRATGSAPGQWKAGDIMFLRESDALKVAPGTLVTDVDHNAGKSRDGQYPHFSTRSWSAQIGTSSWKKGEGNYNVWQMRGNNIIWSGKMTMWNTPNSPTWGTKNELVGHARRASGSAPGQWKEGDIMFASEADARRAVARQFGVTKVGGKLVSSAVDVTGKLTAFGDVEIYGDLRVNGKQVKRRLTETDTMLQHLMDKMAALEAKNAALELRLVMRVCKKRNLNVGTSSEGIFEFSSHS